MSANPTFMQDIILPDNESASPIFDKYEVLPSPAIIDGAILSETEKRPNSGAINPATPQSSPGCYDISNTDVSEYSSLSASSSTKNPDALLSSIDTSEQQYGMLDLIFSLVMHIYNYLVKKSMLSTAQSLLTESGLKHSEISVFGNAHDSFLKEWWDVFWDVYLSKISTPSNPLSPRVSKNLQTTTTTTTTNGGISPSLQSVLPQRTTTLNHGGRKTSFSEVKNGPDQSASISLDSPSTTFSLPNAPALQQGMLFQDFGHGKQKFVGLDSLNLEEKHIWLNQLQQQCYTVYPPPPSSTNSFDRMHPLSNPGLDPSLKKIKVDPSSSLESKPSISNPISTTSSPESHNTVRPQSPSKEIPSLPMFSNDRSLMGFQSSMNNGTFKHRGTSQLQGKMVQGNPQSQPPMKQFVQTPPLPSTTSMISPAQQGASCGSVQQHVYPNISEKQGHLVSSNMQLPHPFQTLSSGFTVHPTQGQLNVLTFQQQQQMLHLQHQQQQALLYQQQQHQQQRWIQQQQQQQQQNQQPQHFPQPQASTTQQPLPLNVMQQPRKISMNQFPQAGPSVSSQPPSQFHMPFLQQQQQSHPHQHYQLHPASRTAHPFGYLNGPLQSFAYRQNGAGNLRTSVGASSSMASIATNKDIGVVADRQSVKVTGLEELNFIDNAQHKLTSLSTMPSENASLIDVFPHSSSVSLSELGQGGNKESSHQHSGSQEPSSSSVMPGISLRASNPSNGDCSNSQQPQQQQQQQQQHYPHSHHHHLNFMTSIVDDEAIGKIEESLLGDLDNLFCSSAGATNTVTETSSTYT